MPSLLALIEVQTRQEVAVDYALELNSEVEAAQSSCYRSSWAQALEDDGSHTCGRVQEETHCSHR